MINFKGEKMPTLRKINTNSVKKIPQLNFKYFIPQLPQNDKTIHFSLLINSILVAEKVD